MLTGSVRDPSVDAAPFLNSGIPELVKLLKSRGQEVFLVSGGFRQIIHPLAAELGIPLSHVYANTILFDVSIDLGILGV